VLTSTPPTTPPATPPPTPAPPRRTGSRRGGVIVVLVAALVALVLYLQNRTQGVDGTGQSSDLLYAPQLNRNAEWTGPSGGFNSVQIEAIAHNAGIEVIPKFAEGWNLQAHFTAAKKIAAAAQAAGHSIKIFDYYNAAFFLNQAKTGWGKYAAGFQQSWLLKDANGQPIPFYGVGQSGSAGSSPIGYVVDLSNPDYRAWAVKTIVSWMHQAPYSGIAFDSANPLLSDVYRASVGNGGRESWSQRLCGADVSQQPVCSRLDAWNEGLAQLLSETSAALHPLGDQVIYNGIAPSVQRGPTRNLGLIKDADYAANESFCISPAPSQPSNLTYMPLTDDATLMRSISGMHKKVLEIVNYQTPQKRALGDYCLAGFLMGWQPGSSYFIFHSGYHDTLTGGYPEVPEQNLQLGNPTESGYQISGSVLSRTFANGWVAVNGGDQAATVKIPINGVQFANGVPGDTHTAGQTMTLLPRQSVFLLSAAYLNRHHCLDPSGQLTGC
jgi:hypothetical protein